MTDEAEIVVLPEDVYARAAAERILCEVRESIGARGRCHLALAGGSTPRPIYRALAAMDGQVPWKEIEFWFGDERCVPPEDPESNYKAALGDFRGDGPGDGERFHRMQGERPPEEAARAYDGVLPDRLDVLLLGMGEDGHTASLFPGSPALSERRRRVVAVADAPKPPARRLTVTPPVIGSARRVLVLVTGEAKAAMVARALEGPLDPRAVPVQLARNGTWLLDRPAASRLQGEKR